MYTWNANQKQKGTKYKIHKASWTNLHIIRLIYSLKWTYLCGYLIMFFIVSFSI